MDTDKDSTTGKDERKTDHDYYLLVPLSYSSGDGSQYNATFIRLFAPSSKVSKECSALKQAFIRAVPKEASKNAAPTAENSAASLTGSDVIEILAMSTDVDLPDVLEVGRRLFLAPGIAKVEGETKLTNTLLGRLDQEDFENMLGEYLVNFTLASTLSKTKTA